MISSERMARCSYGGTGAWLSSANDSDRRNFAKTTRKDVDGHAFLSQRATELRTVRSLYAMRGTVDARPMYWNQGMSLNIQDGRSILHAMFRSMET